jgi:UDP-galactopyranose mutase
MMMRTWKKDEGGGADGNGVKGRGGKPPGGAPLKFAPPEGAPATTTAAPDLVCLSHLRWDFVYQRPQHLLSRFARGRRVFFVEEPVYDDGPARMHVTGRDCGAVVAVPRLPSRLDGDPAQAGVLRGLLDHFFAEQNVGEHLLWYYTPMMLAFTQHLEPLATVYDCMDELTGFRGAPAALKFYEAELFRRADLIFTGGRSLYEAKRARHPHHPHIHAFPSSIDAAHFGQARAHAGDPPDQASIPGPRLGFFGVVDERIDLGLIDSLAAARPDWHLVVVGPVVKIDPAALPRRANIHYLGGKDYRQLPAYLSGWDVGVMPFAHNDSTRFISPTKTPEFLAAGLPVVSTSIRDVVRPYGEQGLVRIADEAGDFVRAVEEAMREDGPERLRKVDAFLARTSWDSTWSRMNSLLEGVCGGRGFGATREGAASA